MISTSVVLSLLGHRLLRDFILERGGGARERLEKRVST